MAQTSPPRPFAVFDIDGTVAREALFLSVVHEICRRGLIPGAEAARIEAAYDAWRKRRRGDPFSDYVQLCVRTIERHLSAIEVSRYEEIVAGVLKQTAEYVYLYTTRLIKELKGKGYVILAISGSEGRTVDHFCLRHGFDDWVGADFHHRDGFFTGSADYTSENKGRYLEEMIKKHGLSLEGSVAVGDTMGDVEMFKMVETPICFNPNIELQRTALENGWTIVVERKNVIYVLGRQEDGRYVLETEAG